MLIVMGPVVGVPATDLFAAAVIPGLLLSLLYIVYTLVRSYLNPALGPGAAAGGARRFDRRGGEGARARHRARRRRHFRDAGRDPGRHRDANRCGRGRRVRRAALDALLPADDVGGIPLGRLLDAAHVVHDPAARRRVELFRRRVLADGQRDADRRIAARPRPVADTDAAADPRASSSCWAGRSNGCRSC